MNNRGLTKITMVLIIVAVVLVVTTGAIISYAVYKNYTSDEQKRVSGNADKTNGAYQSVSNDEMQARYQKLIDNAIAIYYFYPDKSEIERKVESVNYERDKNKIPYNLKGSTTVFYQNAYNYLLGKNSMEGEDLLYGKDMASFSKGKDRNDKNKELYTYSRRNPQYITIFGQAYDGYISGEKYNEVIDLIKNGNIQPIEGSIKGTRNGKFINMSLKNIDKDIIFVNGNFDIDGDGDKDEYYLVFTCDKIDEIKKSIDAIDEEVRFSNGIIEKLDNGISYYTVQSN